MPRISVDERTWVVVERGTTFAGSGTSVSSAESATAGQGDDEKTAVVGPLLRWFERKCEVLESLNH